MGVLATQCTNRCQTRLNSPLGFLSFWTPCSGFDMPRLLEQECLLAYYPLHDKFRKIQLERKWLAINTLPSQQPMEGIKDYFGEKIAMYFGWLGVYTTFLLYACPAGFLTFWVSFGFRSPDCPLTPYMAAFMVRSCTF